MAERAQRIKPMADPKGFLKHGRQTPTRRPVELRILDWNEVYEDFDPGQLRDQGCPLHGLWNPVL